MDANTISTRYHRVLLATDFEAHSRPAFEHALRLAAQLQAQLLLVHVIEGGRSGLRIDQCRANAEHRLQKLVYTAQKCGVQASFLVWAGEPGPMLVEAACAEDAGLIIISSLGSVSDYVLREAECPVLLIPQEPLANEFDRQS